MLIASAGAGACTKAAFTHFAAEAGAGVAHLITFNRNVVQHALKHAETLGAALPGASFALAVCGGQTHIASAPARTRPLALVLSGEVRNFRPLKRRLIAAGKSAPNADESELLCDLIQLYRDRGASIDAALRAALALIDGRLAIAALTHADTGLVLAAASKCCLLYWGAGRGEAALSTQPGAISRAGFDAARPIFEDDCALLAPATLAIVDAAGMTMQRSLTEPAPANEAGVNGERPIEAREPIG